MLLPLLLLQVATPQGAPPPMPLPARLGHAIAWEELPALPYRQEPVMTAAITDFVVGEVKAGRCRANATSGERQTMQVDVAVLVTPEFGARVTIPRAIDCATVEQYAAGLVLSFARNNLSPRTTLATRWYRATMTFEWQP